MVLVRAVRAITPRVNFSATSAAVSQPPVMVKCHGPKAAACGLWSYSGLTTHAITINGLRNTTRRRANHTGTPPSHIMASGITHIGASASTA